MAVAQWWSSHSSIKGLAVYPCSFNGCEWSDSADGQVETCMVGPAISVKSKTIIAIELLYILHFLFCLSGVPLPTVTWSKKNGPFGALWLIVDPKCLSAQPGHLLMYRYERHWKVHCFYCSACLWWVHTHRYNTFHEIPKISVHTKSCLF